MLTESQLSLLLENMPNVAVEGYDIHGRVLLWNRAAEELFGFSRSEAIGKTLDQLILTRSAAEEFVNFLKVVNKSGHGTGPMEWEFRRRNGEIGTVMSTIVPYPTLEGEPRFLCIDIDITESRKYQKALRESELRFRTLAEASLVGLWQVSPEGYTIYINPAMLRMLEVGSAKELQGKTFHAFFTRKSLERMQIEHARRSQGEASNYEAEVVGARGTHRNVIISGAPLFESDGKLHSLIGTFTDITERKQTERQLRRVLDVQRVTLSELDHRVRNNLAALLTLIDISGRGAKSVQDFAASIRGRVNAMAMVHNQLSRSKWEALEMRSILEGLVPDELRSSLRVAGPEQVISPRQCTPLAMVLQELVNNSMKHGAFSRPGGVVELHWSLERNGETQRRDLVIDWSEHGGPPVSAPGKEGTGLDLVRGIVESDLQGSLELSFPRTGVKHCIRFPFEAVDGTF